MLKLTNLLEALRLGLNVITISMCGESQHCPEQLRTLNFKIFGLKLGSSRAEKSNFFLVHRHYKSQQFWQSMLGEYISCPIFRVADVPLQEKRIRRSRYRRLKVSSTATCSIFDKPTFVSNSQESATDELLSNLQFDDRNKEITETMRHTAHHEFRGTTLLCLRARL